MQNRDTYYDSLKFFLIICVIIGHTFDLGGVHDRIVNSLQYWIYTFHMPLFVFVTGYFTNCQSKNFKKGVLNLCSVYIIFQILHIIEDWRMPTVKDIVCPAFSLWYILSCVWWRLMAKVAYPWWNKYKKTTFVASFLLSLLVGFIPHAAIFSVQRTFTFMPFFMGGLLLRNFNVKDVVYKVNPWFCIGILTIAYCFIYAADTNLFPYLTGRYWYAKMPIPLMYGILCRILWYIVAFIMCVAVMRVVPDSNMMSKEGSKTLQYYLLHTLMIPVFWYICNEFGIEHGLGASLGIAILCVLIIYCVKDMKVVSRIVKPVK